MKNKIVNKPEPKPGILQRGDMFAIAVGMVTGGVLPHDEVAGVETILPAAQAILPNIVYKIFLIGGPIMAIITTLNGVFNDVRYRRLQRTDGCQKQYSKKTDLERPSIFIHIH